MIKISKNNNKAVFPTKGSEGAAGYDLHSIEDYTLQPLERKLFSTGLSLEIPNTVYWRIAPRSWLAYKHWIDVLAWVIDSDYRWDVWVLLINLWQEEYKVSQRDRIAQIIFEKIDTSEVVNSWKIDTSERWEGWFGSTWI